VLTLNGIDNKDEKNERNRPSQVDLDALIHQIGKRIEELEGDDRKSKS